MTRIFSIILIILCSVILFSWISFPANHSITKKNSPVADSAALIYQNFCAGCHGEKMDAFVDRKWKHGNTHEDMYKAIKSGYADEGMPAFGDTLSEAQINSLSDYIAKGIENVKQYQFQDTSVKLKNYFPSESMAIKLDTVARDIKVPWGIAFIPGGDLLITDRSGKLYRVKNKKKSEVSGVPEVLAMGQGGLMDVVLHPDFKINNLVYLSYSKINRTETDTLGTTAILRATLQGNKLVNLKIIFEALPYSKTRHHYGSRMVFGKDKKLYFSVGERGNEKENPQSLTNDLGKIHRINDDGSIPKDNPFINTPGAKPTIYCYGNRNPQGILYYPPTGEIWANEHGPRGGDEINIIKKGANYGWPVITYGINYNGKVISNISAQEGMEQPILYWLPSIGPSGFAYVSGDRYPAWKGNVLVGSLRFRYLARCVVKDKKVIYQEMLLKNIGRVRDVRMGPDGYIYVGVEGGYVFKLIPVKKKN